MITEQTAVVQAGALRITETQADLLQAAYAPEDRVIQEPEVVILHQEEVAPPTREAHLQEAVALIKEAVPEPGPVVQATDALTAQVAEAAIQEAAPPDPAVQGQGVQAAAGEGISTPSGWPPGCLIS